MKFKIISTILLILWMVIIFMFSNEDAATSKKTSDTVALNTINTVSKVTGKKYSTKDKKDFIYNSRFIIRKTAHFTLYFILGILIYLTLKSYGINSKIFVYSVLFCLIYAIFDEIHQIFSNGRTFKIIDIFIDTIASVISNYFIYLIYKKKGCKKKENMV